MSAVRDFFLAPGHGGAGNVPVIARASAQASLGVLAPATALPGVACAAGVALARRARSPRALVCLSAPGLRTGAPGSRDRLVASLAARDIAAGRRGRVVVVSLPGDAALAATVARRAMGAAPAVPVVLGVALRSDPLDALLAEQDGLLVVAAGEDAGERLVLASARALVPHAVPLTAVLTPPARALTLAGIATPRAVLRSVAEALA